MSIQIKSQEMIFSKELPLYFLNHNTIIESFLNTPFVLLNFELWKKNGFKKMFQFFLIEQESSIDRARIGTRVKHESTLRIQIESQ